jgi:hypothetical protein
MIGNSSDGCNMGARSLQARTQEGTLFDKLTKYMVRLFSAV